MFIINRECFKSQWQCILRTIEEHTKFKSESYINEFLDGYDKIVNDILATTGGFISGETKLGIVIRLLAGGDAYDLGVIFVYIRISVTGN